MEATNIDDKTVSSFGLQWATYDQARLPEDERTAQRFQEYFAIFPWNTLPDRAVGADVGCGSGRSGASGRTQNRQIALHRCQ